MSQRGKIAAVLSGTTLCMGIIAGAFWVQDWRYTLPTPQPSNLNPSPVGAALPLPAALRARIGSEETRPVFLHFFNPECPCSRFNVEHIRALSRRYGAQARFLAVLQTEDIVAGKAAIRALHLDMEAIADTDGRIARCMGVYSTPQAVLLDRSGRLYYRGNYNLGRYCIEPRSEFARLALEALLADRPCPVFPPKATIAYGCELPSNREPRGGSPTL